MSKNLRLLVLVGIFLVPFVPFLVSSSFFFPFITTKAIAWRIIVEVIFVAWVILALREPTYRPKKSLIVYAVVAFLTVVGLADLFGANPSLSFWSNFERMEGFVSLLHLGAYFFVTISVMHEELWRKWWRTSLVASGLMGVVSLFQFLGWANISQGGARVDGTFGNPIYLAVYMLFHIFIALFFLKREWVNKSARWTYSALILLQLFVLYHTATRGAILGLIGGAVVLGLLNLRSASQVGKRAASAALLGSLLLVGGLYLARSTEIVSQSPVLSRFASLSLEEVKTQGRYFVWPIAWKGFLDQPILGWGQENFSLVFQKYYVPEMYNLEPWFDRAHNIFLDWLVSAGILGLVSYLSLYGMSLFLIWRRTNTFSFTDRSIITALLLAYFFHNLFVFDHLISYILFFSLLAFIHFQTSGSSSNLTAKPVDETWTKIWAGVLVLTFVWVIYAVNLKPMSNNASLIEGMKAKEMGDPALTAKHLKESVDDTSLGRSEIAEQVVTNSLYVLQSDLSTEEKNQFFQFTREVIKGVADRNVQDARSQLFAGSFLTVTGQFEDSERYLLQAEKLIPGKQAVYTSLGALYLNWGKETEALARFKQAYDMSPAYVEAKVSYLTAAIYAEERGLEQELLSKVDEQTLFFDDRIITAYYESGRLAEVREILNGRIERDPANTDTYKKLLQSI